MTIQIVDFPIRNGGSFQFAMLNYQRVAISSHFHHCLQAFWIFPTAPALEVSYAEVKATTLAVMAKDIALGRRQELSMWSQAWEGMIVPTVQCWYTDLCSTNSLNITEL